MMFVNAKFRKSLMLVIFIFTPLILNAMNLNQLITLNKDGSGILRLMYWEKETIIKEKNNIVGSYPFTNEKVGEYFTTNNTFVKGFKVDKYSLDNSFTEVDVLIDFKDINKLNLMKPMADSKISVTPTDSGDIFISIITTAFIKSNFIDNLYTILTYSEGIKSSDGTIKGENIEWFRSKEYLNFTEEMRFYAVLEPTSPGKETTEEKGKPCGLFGFELPVLLLGGLVLTYRKKIKNGIK